MWLINTTSLELEDFMGNPPRYAILSHRWGSTKEEVSFREWHKDHEKIKNRPGYVKIIKACEQAREDNLEYLWVDTNCIDKTSSAELSEAINSMWQYYSEAWVCYTYLNDVMDSVPPGPERLSAPDSEFCKSGWFTRGWTLQELLAPEDLVFYNASWIEIGTKSQLSKLISLLTGINEFYLDHPQSIRSASISCRMSWISNRVTTRVEDIAYCMLGIFNINMSLIYGERHRAFERLQEELIKLSNDETTFAWDWLPNDPESVESQIPRRRAEYLTQLGWRLEKSSSPGSNHSVRSSMIATDPIFFYNSDVFNMGDEQLHSGKPYTMTHLGLSISLLLHCSQHDHSEPRTTKTPTLALIAPQFDLSTDSRSNDSIRSLGFEAVYNFVDVKRCTGGATGGSLLSIEIPRRLLNQHFPFTDCFVPGISYQLPALRDTIIDLGVWSLETTDGPALECVTPLHIRTDGNWISVFSVAWGGEVIYVLVRALRMPRDDREVLWDCQETEIVSQNVMGEKKWTFEGMELSLDEIVELGDNDSNDKKSFLSTWSASILSKHNKSGFEIRLEGEVRAVSNPRFRIRFLHAIPLEDT